MGLGIASIVVMFTCGIGFILAIVSLCLAPGAKREIAESRGALTGEGMVKAGVICSWVTIGFTVLAIVLLGVLLATVDGTWFDGSWDWETN
jgi:hypothetical protein